MSLPPKAALMLVKALARHSIYRDVVLELSDVEELLRSQGCSIDVILVQAAQEALALASVRNWSAAELTAALDRTSLPATLKEALTTFWRENREGIAVLRSAEAAVTAGRPGLSAMRWRVETPTASEGSTHASGSLSEAASTLTLELEVDESGSATPRLVAARATKAQVQALLSGVQAARRVVEKAASDPL
jgi:hypothetical protein